MLPAAGDHEISSANRLESYVRRVVESTELPMFSKRLIELLALPNSDHTSAQKLAAPGLEDYALTFKLLRMANSFHYNRSNRPSEGISHAIVVLGMRTVLKLASTLTYLDYFERHGGELRQLGARRRGHARDVRQPRRGHTHAGRATELNSLKRCDGTRVPQVRSL